MYIQVRSGSKTWRGGRTTQQFTDTDIGSTFRAFVTLSNQVPGDEPVERELLIESVFPDQEIVCATIHGM